jgi:3-dehydroquinate dehydratase
MATAEQLKIQLTADNQASAPINKLRQDVENLDKSGKRASASLAASNGRLQGSFATMGRGAGQAGVQIQQFVGQIQGGTNPMLAFSQQAADLGIVLGAPLVGVVAALGASLAMTLVPNLFASKTATEDLKKEIKELTDSYENATMRQKEFALSLIASEIQEQEDDIINLKKSYADVGKEIERTKKFIEDYTGFTSKATLEQNLGLKESQQEYQRLGAAIDTATQRITNLKDQQNEIKGLQTAEDLKKQAEEQEKINQGHAQYIAQLEQEMITFGMNSDQKARFRALNMPEEYRATALAIHDNIMTMKMEKRQFEETEKAKEEIRKSSMDGFNKLAAQNKKLFQVQKAYNIANAIMDTYAGANKALALYPPPISYAMAAGQIALGMANVATIKSQSFSGRAVGGRVEAGTPYMVGEQGREMFIPSTRGEIVKNSDVEAMGGSRGAVNVNFTINAVDTRGFSELLSSRRSQIVNMVNQAMNDRGRAGVTA